MECSPEDVSSSAINRWRAAVYGLQAKMIWDGEERPVTELARSMINLAEEGMSMLGASQKDLSVIDTMLKKRQTQADFVIALEKGDPDPHRLLRSAVTIYNRDHDAFKTYLKIAPTLPVVDPMSMEEFLLSKITKDVPAFEVAVLTPLSPYDFDVLIDRLRQEGKVRVEEDLQWGRTISRT
jgi:hypothetical protein